MIAFITFVLVVMLFRPAQQLEVISTGLLALGIICTVPIMSRWKSWYCGKNCRCKIRVNPVPGARRRVFRSKNMTAIPGRRPLTDTVG